MSVAHFVCKIRNGRRGGSRIFFTYVKKISKTKISPAGEEGGEARGIRKRNPKKTRTSTKQSQLYNTFYTNNKFGCFAPYQSSSACLWNTKNSDSEMDSLPFGVAFLVGYLRWLLSPTNPELSGFKAPETRLSHLFQ